MSRQDRAFRFQNLESRKSRVIVACAWLVIALLVAGCARFTYNPTPTVVYVAPPPTSIPTVATATPMPTPTPTLAPEGPTILRIEPAVVDLNVNETHPVEVWLDNAKQLHSIELHIGFDPGYVRIQDADPDAGGIQVGEGVMPVPAQVMQNEVNNDAGLITYHVAKEPGSLGSRSGTVASFTVQALAEGGSPLRFNVVKLFDSEEQPLPVQEQVDGLVVISAGGDAPEPAGEAAPTQAPAAETPTPSTPTPSPIPTSPSTTTGIYYTVQPGENLFRIGLRYGTTVDAIVAANDLPDRSSVQAGQTLLIPVSPSAGTVAYVVQPGDTVYSIARRFGTTVETLAALNGIDPSYAIKAGQTLIIVP